MKSYLTFLFALLSMAGIAIHLQAAPFQVLSEAEMREDYRLSWASFGSGHGDAVPDGQVFAIAGQGDVMVSSGSAMMLHNADTHGGLATPGVHLSVVAQEGVRITPPQPVQGFGVIVEHLVATAAGSFTLQVHSPMNDLLGTLMVSAPGAGVPVLLGIVDPDAAIGSITIEASPAGRFALAEPVFQLPADIEGDLSKLPITASVTVPLATTATFLHEGLDTRTATPETSDAIQDFANSVDLAAAFPSMRRGDILRFERIGLSLDGATINHTLGVLSSSAVIATGNALLRVPGAIDVGPDFFTKSVTTSTSGTFSTPTNIDEDFLIGESSFINVPQGARYAFFSLAKPRTNRSPVQVKVSLIHRSQFEDWVAAKGLVGPLAVTTSDLDGDGLTLLEEFAYFKDPTENDVDAAEGGFGPRQVGTGDDVDEPLAFRFSARLGTEFRYLAEFSSDLDDWQAMEAATLLPLNVASTSATEPSVFLAVDPGHDETAARRFGRVTIERVVRNAP